MRQLLFGVAFLISLQGVAQISNVEMNGVPVRTSAYTEIAGSPYLFADWAKADVATTNGGLKEDVAYRFNIHDNELEVINEAGNNMYLNKDYLEYVILERPAVPLADGAEGQLPSLLFKKGFDMIQGVDTKDLINVLAEGKKYTFVRKFYSELVTPPKNSYNPTPGRMFVYEETFYLIQANQTVSPVKNKTNVILKALDPADVEKAKQVIKDLNLSLSREDHLVVFFEELNKS